MDPIYNIITAAKNILSSPPPKKETNPSNNHRKDKAQPPLQIFIAPPCEAACAATQEEKHLYQLAVTTKGSLTSSLPVPEVNLSGIITCVKIISSDQVSVYFDGAILFISESFLEGKSDAAIQDEIRMAIINYVGNKYQEVISSPDGKLKEAFASYCLLLFNSGFTESPLSIIINLLVCDLADSDRVFFEDQIFGADQETIKQILFSKNLELMDRYIALFDEIKGKPSDSQLIARRQLEAAMGMLLVLASHWGLSSTDLEALAASHLSLNKPDLYQKALDLTANKDKEQILRLCSDLQNRPPLDLKAFIEGLFLVKIIWQLHFKESPSAAFQTEIFFNENKDFHPAFKPFYFLLLDYKAHPDIIFRTQVINELNTSLKNEMLSLLKSLPKEQQNKLRAQCLFILNLFYVNGIMEGKDLTYWMLGLSWPDLPEKEINLLYQIIQSPEYQKNNTYQSLESMDLSSYSASFKEALSYFLILDLENPQTQLLIQNIKKLSKLKTEYEEMLDQAYQAFHQGNKARFDTLWQKAGVVSKEAEKLRLIVREQLASHHKLWQNHFVNEEDIAALNLGHLFWATGTQKEENALSLAKDYLATTGKNIMAGKKINARKTLHDLVINVYRAGEYSEYSLFSISWNLHARLEKTKTILTPKRLALIKTYAQKYNVDPYLLAAIIVCEQRDQTNAENSTDLLGGILGYNTSIGLGQVSVETARSLFPDLFEKASDLQVTNKLLDEAFNIEATAKYLQRLQKEGEKLLKRTPAIAEIGSRYTSTLYDSNHSWGKFVEMTYYELSISGLINNTPNAMPYLEYRISMDKDKTSQISFQTAILSCQTSLQQSVPKNSAFYQHWQKTFTALSETNVEDLPLSEQICHSRLISDFYCFLNYYLNTENLTAILQSELELLIPYEAIDPNIGDLINQYLYLIQELDKCKKLFLDNHCGTAVAAYLQIDEYYFTKILPEFEKINPALQTPSQY